MENSEKPTMMGVFSGIGGFELAATWAGLRVVAMCEIEPFPCAVLTKHFPGAYLHDDIRTLTPAALRERGINRIDVLCGGPPCQPASIAGQRQGQKDDRWLWPEFIRLVRELRPAFFLAENPLGLLSLDGGNAFEGICTALETEGYETQAFIISASNVGAPHRRERVWIVGKLADAYSQRRKEPGCGKSGGEELPSSELGCTDELAHVKSQQNRGVSVGEVSPELEPGGAITLAYCPKFYATRSFVKRDRREQFKMSDRDGGLPAFPPGPSGDWSGIPAELWPSVPRVESGVCVLVNGIPVRMARRYRNAQLKALGNAIVPQAAFVILKGIAELIVQ